MTTASACTGASGSQETSIAHSCSRSKSIPRASRRNIETASWRCSSREPKATSRERSKSFEPPLRIRRNPVFGGRTMASRRELQLQQKREVEKKQEPTIPARQFLPPADIFETDR